MPRPHRLNVPGGIYHVTSRGNRRQLIFLDDRDHRTFLQLLGGVCDRLGWRCQGYCLMPNHYHAVIETPQPNLSSGMQELNSRYAEGFNRRHGLDGHVFQGRFHSRFVTSQWHLLELSRYLSLNPVRAGVCTHPADWPWSSFPALSGRVRVPPFLAAGVVLDHFGRDRGAACEAFHRFVLDAA
jgi:putative transposase